MTPEEQAKDLAAKHQALSQAQQSQQNYGGLYNTGLMQQGPVTWSNSQFPTYGLLGCGQLGTGLAGQWYTAAQSPPETKDEAYSKKFKFQKAVLATVIMEDVKRLSTIGMATSAFYFLITLVTLSVSSDAHSLYWITRVIMGSWLGLSAGWMCWGVRSKSRHWIEMLQKKD